MATLTLSRDEVARLLKAVPRLELDKLDTDRVVVKVRTGVLRHRQKAEVVVEECRKGRLRLRVGPAWLSWPAGFIMRKLRKFRNGLAEHGVRPVKGGRWEVDSAALLGRWLPGAKLDEVVLAPDGVRLTLAL